jgi:putative N-acetylmannosamine-6-phosphate epimerase
VPLAHNEGGGGGPEQIKEEEDREEDHLISSLDHVVKLRFVVILRGHCSFEEKVRNAQDAGYDAVIVADNVDNGPLPTSKCSIF